MIVCSDCPAFSTGETQKVENGFQVKMYDHCIFWKWVSISAVMPTYPPETCNIKSLFKALLYSDLVLTKSGSKYTAIWHDITKEIREDEEELIARHGLTGE